MNIRIDGIEELTQHLEELVDKERLMKDLGKACAIVERSAKEKAPKGTGELRRSITSEVTEDDGELIGTVFTPLEYAPYVEYGTGLFAESGGRKDVPWRYQDDKGEWHTTSGQHPQPYMRPALNENRDKILKLLRESLRNG